MNDVSRTTQLELAPNYARESWWRASRRTLRHSRLASFLLVAICLAGFAGLGWFLAHRNAVRGPAGGFNRARATATVGFAVAGHADVPIFLEALGTVTPLATATVKAQVSGVLTQVLYTEGQLVKAGQPLVQIDPRPFQLTLDQAVGALARDEAQLANNKIILERDKTLLSQDSIAQQDVDTQAATVKQLEGSVTADRASLNTARLNLEFARVTAPISGRVGLRPVDVGNFVSTGDANGVATITQLMPIDVAFSLPADTVARVHQRLAAGAKLATTVLDRTRTVTLGEGTFLTLDNQIDAQTGTVKGKARFANADGALFPQQFVNVRLLLDTLHDAVVVPSAAVRHGPQGDYVYVIAEDRSAHITAVKVGPANGDQVSISSGLQGGERVVTEGGDRLVDGATVRLPGQTPAAWQQNGARKNWQQNGAGKNWQQNGAGKGSKWRGGNGTDRARPPGDGS
jgi:multidrug efflux system membrane fusion protein